MITCIGSRISLRRLAWQGVLLTCGWSAAFALPALLSAGESNVQSRDFQISVDGQRCGKLRLTITEQADGRLIAEEDASLELKYVVYTFRYLSKGHETWYQGRLERLDNVARYGGTRHQVSAKAQGDKLLLKVDGTERVTRGDVWVTSYWHEPSQGLVGTKVRLLDSDKGRELEAKLEFVGEQLLSIGGRQQPCPHYRLRGNVEVDVWYDAEQRIVRQEAIESKHKTLLELVEIRR